MTNKKGSRRTRKPLKIVKTILYIKQNYTNKISKKELNTLIKHITDQIMLDMYYTQKYKM